MDVAVSQNALRHQLNLESEGEKDSPVLLQLLKTLNVQDINLEEYVINEVNINFIIFNAMINNNYFTKLMNYYLLIIYYQCIYV